jgi:DNA polymerase delta subunit 2
MAPDASMAPADDMLSEPTGAADPPALTRAVLEYAANDDRFSLDKKIYGQYFQLYFQRLMLLLPRLKETVVGLVQGESSR